ncbi:hypothetical protein BW41_02321 [Sphingomonas sp. RIT328]|nr:hypothetical protein BW41_02321 [Sphingomonas sp. RIT328]
MGAQVMAAFAFLPGTGRGTSEAGGGGLPQTHRWWSAPSTSLRLVPVPGRILA